MNTQVIKATRKSLNLPDEVRHFDNGRIDVVNLPDGTASLITLQPGWRWSQDVRPLVGTESCQNEHRQYVLTGRLMVVSDDGSELELHPGDVAVIPPGHDAWVLGDETFTAIEFGDMTHYARTLQTEDTM